MLKAAAVPVSLSSRLDHSHVADADGWPGLQHPVSEIKPTERKKKGRKKMPDADTHEREHRNHLRAEM